MPSRLYLMSFCGGKKASDGISLTTDALRFIHAVSSGVIPLQPLTSSDMMNRQSNPKLFADWTGIVCASVVAVTGGIKDCCSGEPSHPAADEKSVLYLRGKNTYFTEHGEET